MHSTDRFDINDDSQTTASFLAYSSSSMAFPASTTSQFLPEDDEMQPLLNSTNTCKRHKSGRSLREKLDTIPGAWIEEEEMEENGVYNDLIDENEKSSSDYERSEGANSDSDTSSVFIRSVPEQPPRITTTIVVDDLFTTTRDSKSGGCSNNSDSIEWLKQAIASLKEEQEKLEETNHIVKKSIQIVAKKRSKAAAQITQKNNDKRKATVDSKTQENVITEGVPSQKFIAQGDEIVAVDTEQCRSNSIQADGNGNSNVFIIVTKSDFTIPSEQELRAAGIDDSWEWITTFV